jgi:hypothetical protein
MAGRLDKVLDRLVFRRALARWSAAAEQAPKIGIEGLRAMRTRARQLRRELDRVIHQAEYRLALPVIGVTAIRKPMGTDWAWRPDIWKGQIPTPGMSSVPARAQVCDGATVFHDCRRSELTVRRG